MKRAFLIVSAFLILLSSAGLPLHAHQCKHSGKVSVSLKYAVENDYCHDEHHDCNHSKTESHQCDIEACCNVLNVFVHEDYIQDLAESESFIPDGEQLLSPLFDSNINLSILKPDVLSNVDNTLKVQSGKDISIALQVFRC